MAEDDGVEFRFELPSIDIPPELIEKLVEMEVVYRHPDRLDALAASPTTPHACVLLLVVLRNALELANLTAAEPGAEEYARTMKEAIDLSLEDAVRMVALLTQVDWPKPEDTEVRPGYFDRINPN